MRPHVQSIGVAAVIQGNNPTSNIRWTTYPSYGNYPNNNNIINNNNFGFQEPAPQISSDTNQHIPDQQQQQNNQHIPNQNVSGNQPQQAQQQPTNIFNTSMGMPNFPNISQNVMNDIQSIINNEINNLHEQPSHGDHNPPQFQVETAVIDIADDDVNIDDQHIDNIIMQALNRPINNTVNMNVQANDGNNQQSMNVINNNTNNNNTNSREYTVPITQTNINNQQNTVPVTNTRSIFEESKIQENQNTVRNTANTN